MSIVTVFQLEGNWYKGNLHVHSTFSDGQLKPEEIVQLYKNKGYSFISITDHNIYIDHTHLDSDSFITLPGVEVSVNNVYGDKPPFGMHVIAVARKLPAGFKNFQQFPTEDHERIDSIQAYLDYLREKGMLLILAHPVWHGLEIYDYMDLKGFIGMEIFNSDCDADGGRGYSVLQWDSLLRRNIRLLGFATDDSHRFVREWIDWNGGYIVVKAPSLTRDDIIKAIENGMFYASQGPEIYNFSYDEESNSLCVSCSPVKQIRFLTYERRGQVIYAPGNETITEAKYLLRNEGIYNFARVEVIDQNGKIAYTNPVFFHDGYVHQRLMQNRCK